jgi:hypothetical protein
MKEKGIIRTLKDKEVSKFQRTDNKCYTFISTICQSKIMRKLTSALTHNKYTKKQKPLQFERAPYV